MRRRIRNKMQNLAQAVASSFSSSSGQYTLVCSSFPRGLSCCEKLTKLTRCDVRLTKYTGLLVCLKVVFGFQILETQFTYRTIVLNKEHIVHWSARLFPEDCLGFAFCPLGLPLTTCLLPLASCLLDCLGFAFCPFAGLKPGSTVNRHSDKSLFLLTLHKSENEKRKQRGRMLKLSSAKLVCCVQSWNTRLSCFLEL